MLFWMLNGCYCSWCYWSVLHISPLGKRRKERGLLIETQHEIKWPFWRGGQFSVCALPIILPFQRFYLRTFLQWSAENRTAIEPACCLLAGHKLKICSHFIWGCLLFYLFTGTKTKSWPVVVVTDTSTNTNTLKDVLLTCSLAHLLCFASNCRVEIWAFKCCCSCLSAVIVGSKLSAIIA